MRPLLLSALFVSLLALGACDSDTTEEPPPPPPEEIVPVVFEYRVDAPQDISDFGIRYTGEDGEEVVVPTAPPFAFPFVEILDPLPVEARGPYSVRIFGFVQSGGVTARVRAFRDGLLVATAQVSSAGDAMGAVDVTATLTIGPDGEIIEE
ncbi:hypothetical protein [Rubrivirga sp. IMCC45206]|uniref:hypothetical protein n=1 Tax=Rubrivirga sp. IMCC45206 TaxID=3391614 RepID=UPI00398FCBB7